MPKGDDRSYNDHAYRDNLAYIHDVGFGGFAKSAAPWLLELLQKQVQVRELVIDLGCGSGIWAQALSGAGYPVLGYDQSPAMVAIARSRVPEAEFRVNSFLRAELPACTAVTALGEVFNYLFDKQNTTQSLQKLFRRIHKALLPGGLLVFDVALPGRVPGGQRRGFSEGEDWACLFEAEEDPARRMLTRRITSFRKVGQHYRRDFEVHRLRLYDCAELAAQLRAIGFRVRRLTSYGSAVFPPGYAGFIARKG